MTNAEVVKALEEIKTYCAANLLDELEFAQKVIKKLEEAGIENPLEADFTKLK